MATTDYALDDRTVVKAALETYAYNNGTTNGSDALTYEAINIFDAFDPVQHNQEVLTFDRAKDSLTPDGVAPLEAFTDFAFKAFMYGSGVETAPGWARLFLPSCGFIQSGHSGTKLAALTSIAAATNGTYTTGLAPGTYKYTVTDVVLATREESHAQDTAETITITTAPSTEQTGFKVILTFAAAVPADHIYRIYRSKVGGTIKYLLAEVQASAATFVDQSGVYGGVVYRTSPPDGNATALSADAALDLTRVSPDVTPTPAANTANVFTLLNEDFNSLNGKVYLNGQLVPFGGARGNFEASWEAGRPCEMNYTLRGIYHDRSGGAANENPSGSCVDPGPPLNVINITPFLNPISPNSTWTTDLGNGIGNQLSSAPSAVLNGYPLTPIEIKSCKWTPGFELDNRRSVSSSQAVKEVILGRKRTGAMVSIVVEVDRDFQWDPVKDFKNGCRFGYGFTIQTEDSVKDFRRIEHGWPNLQIRSAPRLVREDGAIRCWELSFVPLAMLNCWDSMHLRIY